MEWDQAEFIGDTLPEYQLLDYPINSRACYIVCPGCMEQHRQEPEAREFCEQKSQEIDQELRKKLGEDGMDQEGVSPKKERPSRSESMTDATTLEESEVMTPAFGVELGRAPVLKVE